MDVIKMKNTQWGGGWVNKTGRECTHHVPIMYPSCTHHVPIMYGVAGQGQCQHSHDNLFTPIT